MNERLQKLISQAGIASRRAAEELILKGKVTINGKKATLGDKGSFADNILVNGMPLLKEEHVYYLMNKPEKTICSLKDPQGRVVITDLINDQRHIFPVGRLDYDTTGTILLTNDGELSNRLTHPSYQVVRVYRARLSAPVSDRDLAFLNSDDVYLDDRQSKQKVSQVDKKSYVVALTVGTYHHVKRLFELVDNNVMSLTRIEFAGLSHVDKLARGQYMELKGRDVRWLKKLVGIEK